jgi:hypothetical protein
MIFFRKLQSIRFELFVLLIISILIIVIIDFTHFRFNALIKGSSIKINEILSRLSLAYISSFIFYFVVVYLKEETDRKNVYPYIKHQIHSIFSIHKIVISKLKDSDINENIFLNKEELARILDKVSPLDSIKSIEQMPHGTFYELLVFESKHAKNAIYLLFGKMKYIDSELSKILFEIENSNFISFGINELQYYSKYEKNLSFLLDTYYYYNLLLIKLESYTGKNLNKYY